MSASRIISRRLLTGELIIGRTAILVQRAEAGTAKYIGLLRDVITCVDVAPVVVIVFIAVRVVLRKRSTGGKLQLVFVPVRFRADRLRLIHHGIQTRLDPQ